MGMFISESNNRKPHKGPSVIPCGVGLIRRGEEFLIAQRYPEDTFGSCWEFPGGVRKPKESFEECVVREVREELGVEVRVERKFMEMRRQFNNRVIWLNFFLTSFISGDPRAIECQAFTWVRVEELKNYRFPPANETVIDKLMKEFYREENV